MKHSDLDKTKVLKTQRDFKSDVRKPNFKSVLNSVLLVRSVKPISEQVQSTGLVWSFTGFQRHFLDMSGLGLDMSGEQYDH
jgi:hypothetical protein